MSQSINATVVLSSSAAKSRIHWRGFFVTMAALLAAIVAVGFAPSFYFPDYFLTHGGGLTNHATLPTYIHVHGILLTSWFTLFLVQTILVAWRRVRLHRFLGVAGASLAAALVGSSMLVVVRLAARATAVDKGEQVALIVTGDTGIVILFALLVIAGISYRRLPDAHKRLMLLASISLVAPALARLPGAEAFIPISVVVPQLVMFAAVIVYDIASRRRVHVATACGVAMYLIVMVIATAVGFSAIGNAFVKALA